VSTALENPSTPLPSYRGTAVSLCHRLAAAESPPNPATTLHRIAPGKDIVPARKRLDNRKNDAGGAAPKRKSPRTLFKACAGHKKHRSGRYAACPRTLGTGISKNVDAANQIKNTW
jgi:hypothetical protein